MYKKISVNLVSGYSIYLFGIKKQFIARIGNKNEPLLSMYYKQRYISNFCSLIPKQYVYILKNSKYILIEEFLEGTLVQPEKIDLVKLAKSLFKLHSATFNYIRPSIIKKYTINFFIDLINFNESFFSKKTLKLLFKLVEFLKSLDFNCYMFLAHEDVSFNIIECKNKYKFIDFEFNRNIASWFDLADIICEYNLSSERKNQLLDAYFENIDNLEKENFILIIEVFEIIKFLREMYIFRDNSLIFNENFKNINIKLNSWRII